MESTINFNRTMSVAAFKASRNISTINVVKNPHTEKLFFTCPDDSDVSGKVSTKLDTTKPLCISDFADTESGEKFLLLHNQGTSTVNVQLSL
jgi:hypothetical protein